MAHIEKRGNPRTEKNKALHMQGFVLIASKCKHIDGSTRYFTGNFVLNPFGYLKLSAWA
jgi:hypothetical protein